MAEEKKKLCPMSFNNPEQIDILKCKKEQCAWWGKSTGDCAILMIGNYIATGWLLLDDFLSKKKGK